MVSTIEQVYALGPAGSNGDEAAREFQKIFPEMLNRASIHYASSNLSVIAETMDVEEKKAVGVVPIENSSAGYVVEVMKFWLSKPPAYLRPVVIGEVDWPIRHQLLVRPGVTLDQVTEVISHPQAISQCSILLKNFGLAEKTRPIESTSKAAWLLATDDSTYATTAAISSRLAGEYYHLDFLAADIHDSPDNSTRFHLLGRAGSHVDVTGRDRTAMLCWTKNEPGSLLKILWPISSNEINMSSIVSIPLGRSNTYAFYLEFDEHMDSSVGQKIQKLIAEETEDFLVLGSYPRYQKPEG